MLNRLWPAVLAASAILLSGAGCSSQEVGSQDFAAVSGYYTSIEGADFDKTRAATYQAMRKLGLKPMETKRDAFTCTFLGTVIVGTISQEREITVRVKKLTDDKTEIRQHIVFTRSPEKMELILAEIRKILNAQGAKAPKETSVAGKEKAPPAPQ
jgi:hypothetical protein